MPQSRVRTRFAMVGALSLLAAVPAQAQTQAPTHAPVQMPAHTTIYPVTFPTGSTDLHVADNETIHGVAALMERDPTLTATILGKTDTVGSPEYNEHLSQRRAQAVFDLMVYKYDAPANRVEIRWTGERLPSVPTADQTAELQNRVVEILVYQPPPRTTAYSVEDLPPGRVYAFHSDQHGACPELDWHVVVGNNDALTGLISWNNQQNVARATGTLNRQTRTFQMSAQEVGGQGRTANISGTVGQDGWLLANIEGPTVNCQGVDVPWFVPPPRG